MLFSGVIKEENVHVGSEYQAEVPKLLDNIYTANKVNLRDRALMVWNPPEDEEIAEKEVNFFCEEARKKKGYSEDQALGLLFWNRFNVDKSWEHVQEYSVIPDGWSSDEKQLFEQAFSFHGKSFHRIKQMMPDKSIASLVNYYYSWKKTRSAISYLEHVSDKVGNWTSDPTSDAEDVDDPPVKTNPIKCVFCDKETTESRSIGSISACLDCYAEKNATRPNKRRRIVRQDKNSTKSESLLMSRKRIKRNLAKDMAVPTEAQVREILQNPSMQDEILEQSQATLREVKKELQDMKMSVEGIKKLCDKDKFDFTKPKQDRNYNACWSSDEVQLYLLAIRHYGRDFKSIAAILGTKTELDAVNFFTSQNRKYNLDQLLMDIEKGKRKRNCMDDQVTESKSDEEADKP